MKDYQIEILTAFFVALTQQSEPLSADFVVKLNQISESLDFNQLSQLIKNSSLQENYQIAYNRLAPQSSFRGLGLDVIPNHQSEVENTTCTEVENLASRIPEQNLDEILHQIKTRLHENESLGKKILGNINPIEAAKTLLLLTSGF
jgi:hypothetical protein